MCMAGYPDPSRPRYLKTVWGVGYKLVPGSHASTFGGNPFSESFPIVEFIKARTDRTDRIGIIGSEPQIFFYSQRRSATGYIYMYSLLEDQPYALRMQEEMIQQLESAQPRLLLYFNVRPSLSEHQRRQERIFDWFAEYSAKHYDLVARLEYTPGANSLVFLTERQALLQEPRQVYWITIFEKKSNPVPSSPKATL